MGGNIEASDTDSLSWDPADCVASLDKVRRYVEGAALQAAAWYLSAKRSKARWSQAIRMAAILATALAGLLPIATKVWPAAGAPGLDTGLWASLLVGLAAALLGVDRAFGFSTGWIRYILTASSIRKSLEEFRLDWALLVAQLDSPPGEAQVEALLRRAREFLSSIEAQVIQETKDWATEFQNNLAQLEKDAKAQLDALQAKVEQDAKGAQDASRPSALDLTVPNAGVFDDGFTVVLQGVAGQLASEHVSGSDKWARLGLAPGVYKLKLAARIKGRDLTTEKIITLSPGTVLPETLALPES